ncbi:iron complex outermembrane receptor protein [Sphingobacterium allocomposti]|uniref:Iron complex outermembrane receptor protein n=1 Tax=Sphingobacterium allocomposti TaxID=415956 RepID=A0A5S5DSW6_9SPHI|nr:TonB-dependent receptor [Sphingobacterium composti Yoo et al. 2007 non Ten et al. 2007]TYP97749.1 iron complex outermembrane receptor protein [Sphingobacterium composti Yoo et al. 2007 non Ten et al. 2007]
MKRNRVRLYSTCILLFALGLESPNLYAQVETKPIINASITGTVIDGETKEPLAGVTVQLEAVTHSVKTDVDGKFRFVTGQKLPVTVVVTYVGYQRKSVVLSEPSSVIELSPSVENLNEVVVTSRRRREQLQDIPLPVSLIRSATIEDAGAFNVSRIKEIVPTVQLYASNARNTTLNIRGLGSTYGLTNDGIDPGVGFYLDGVYMARPAATWLDFIDIEQIEVLRGPQGTLFGKNTTAGAFNITSRLPYFHPEANFEVNYGNYGFIQGKASLTGPLIKDKLAARVSFSGTQRDGTLYNVAADRAINDMNNIGFRGQLLYTPRSDVKVSLVGDVTKQRPDGYGWGIAGVVKNQRSAYRQFDRILEDLGYQIPYESAFERKVDLDTRSRADNELGGLSLNIDYKLGNGTLTSTSAWRYWKWVPLNDRDYLGIPVYTVSSGNSLHDQWSQEFRYAGQLGENISGVVGVFGLWQDLRTDPVHTEEAGDALWRFQQQNASQTQWGPGLIDRVGIRTRYGIKSASLAAFSQIDWAVTPKLHILPGLRYNYDKKTADYDRKKYIENNIAYTAEQFAAVNSIYSDQQFLVDADAANFSGQLSLQYKFTPRYNVYTTYSRSYKPIGINVGGLPVIDGRVATELAEVKPESVNHVEFGLKSNPLPNTFLNITAYRSHIKDYQTQVQTPDPGVNRGYLANAERVRVQGVEVDGSFQLKDYFRLNAALAYTDGKYVTFTNAPVPLEEVGGELAFKDISGGVLPGISKWSWSAGAELTQKGRLLTLEGRYFIGLDVFYRSDFSSSPSPSQYLNVESYALVNARVGFRATRGLSVIVWSRNLTDRDYYEQLLAAPGNFGQYAGVIGDPRTYGVTLRCALK